MKKSRTKVLAFFKQIELKFGYSIRDILSMRGPEFNTFVESLSDHKVEEKPKLTTLDQAFPQFFTDPFANRKGSKS